MALITCIECQRQISDRAQACLNCGCPVSASIAAAAENSVAEPAAAPVAPTPDLPQPAAPRPASRPIAAPAPRPVPAPVVQGSASAPVALAEPQPVESPEAEGDKPYVPVVPKPKFRPIFFLIFGLGTIFKAIKLAVSAGGTDRFGNAVAAPWWQYAFIVVFTVVWVRWVSFKTMGKLIDCRTCKMQTVALREGVIFASYHCERCGTRSGRWQLG